MTNVSTSAHATYGQLAVAAAAQAVPAAPPLLGTQSPRIIGHATQRLDIPSKVNGTAVFGIDVRLPGMLFAAVRLAPKVGQVATSVGKAPTGSTVVNLLDAAGTGIIGIAATSSVSTWHAMQAVRGVSITWKDATFTAATDSAAMAASARSLMTAGTPLVAKDVGGAAAAVSSAARTVAATYSAPYLAHATMEPLCATAQVVTGTSCEIWAPTQNQAGCVQAATALTGLPADKVKVHTTLLGGGLGRKYELDFVRFAIQVAKASGGKPVKVMWSREEDFTHDAYRPASLCQLTAGLDASGTPVGITSRTVSQSIYAGRGWLPPGLVDPSAVEGLLMKGGDDTVAYALGDHQRTEWINDTTAHVPTGFWRSVGNSYNVFFLESFLDEVAKAAGRDPLAFRLGMLDPASREWAVLDTLRQVSGWATPAAGVGRGVAISRSFGGTICAQVAEVTGTATAFSIRKVTAVIDCGTVINPDTVSAQVEGAILQGIAAAMWQDMPFAAGAPVRRNFSTYRMARLRETPAISVTIVPGKGNPPGGVGEPGVPAAAPAVANAVAALTGTRFRSLPFFPQSTARSGS